MVPSGFDLFSLQVRTKEIVESAADLVDRMSALLRPRQAALAAIPGDDYFDVDGRLMDRVEEVLVPMLGSNVGDGASWYQHCGNNDDGVRHLAFDEAHFPAAALSGLHALLSGEFAPFCILCWINRRDASGDYEEGLVLFSDTLVITRGLARALVVTAAPVAR